MPTLLIYGATGYTGRLASAHARELGLDFAIAGRNAVTLRVLGTALQTPYRVFDIAKAQSVDHALADIDILLNCAGPFMRTADPLMIACIRQNVHYLDIAAELDSYELAEKYHDQAVQAGIMLLPGCGGSVTMLGCLAGYAISALSLEQGGSEAAQRVASVDIALQVTGSMSRGSLASAAENISGRCLQRQDGQLVEQDVANVLGFNFDSDANLDGIRREDQAVACFPVTLPDLITIWKSTRVPNIRTYVDAAGASFSSGEDLQNLPNGPSRESRASTPYHAAVKLTTAEGIVHEWVLHTINGYTFTAVASVEATRLLLEGKVEIDPGLRTPVDMLGNDFVVTLGGSSIVKRLQA